MHVSSIFKYTSPVSDAAHHFLIISHFQVKSQPVCLPRFLLTGGKKSLSVMSLSLADWGELISYWRTKEPIRKPASS